MCGMPWQCSIDLCRHGAHLAHWQAGTGYGGQHEGPQGASQRHRGQAQQVKVKQQSTPIVAVPLCIKPQLSLGASLA